MIVNKQPPRVREGKSPRISTATNSAWTHVAKYALALSLLLPTSTTFADVSGDPEKLPGWIVAYETDASGATTRGSLAKLIRAVESGADIKIATDNGTIYRTCDSVSIVPIAGAQHIGCAINNQISLLSSVDPTTIRPAPYRTFYWWDTAGNTALARASIYGGANLGQSSNTGIFGVTWFARVR